MASASGQDPVQAASAAPARRLPRLVLASASPRRQALLAQMGARFEVFASQVEELLFEELTARELSLLNAYRKARAVAKHFPDRLVLGADTLVCLGARLFGKPATLAEAEETLAHLQGRTHQVVTGICLLHLRRHRHRLFAELTDVTFRPLSSEQIRAYIAAVNPLDKAGAYAIQERGEELVSKVSGSYANVVGLPVERLQEELRTWAAGR
jgi:septum formation protein